jgi:hypothetical protein
VYNKVSCRSWQISTSHVHHLYYRDLAVPIVVDSCTHHINSVQQLNLVLSQQVHELSDNRFLMLIHDVKVGAWCAISAARTILPITLVRVKG